MIASLRRGHRRAFLAMSAVLPAVVAAGIGARVRVPWERPGPARRRFERGLWPGWDIGTAWGHSAEGGVRLMLEFDDLRHPDVLLYFCAGDRLPGEALPMDAWLVGGVARSTGMLVPAELSGRRGRLVLYSLGDNMVLAVSSVMNLPRAEGGPG